MGTYCCSAQGGQSLDADKSKFKPSIRKSADISKFAAKLKELQKDERAFIDTEFPPRRESIVKDSKSLQGSETPGSKHLEIGDTNWKRAEEIPCLLNGEGNLALFLDEIEPDDIRMGGLDDAYFLSVLSGLAEVPERIRELFVSQVVNPQGLFGVRLIQDGIMQEVLVDSYVPVNENDELQFSKTHGPELWVIMLEKAYAKVKGCYMSIGSGGQPEHAISDLTGAPWTKLYTKDMDGDELFQKIFDYDTKEYVMSTSIAPQAGHQNEYLEDLRQLGLMDSHAYTLLGCAQVVDSNGNDARIVCIRNPWGNFEWNGDWSDQSHLWTDEAKELVGFVEEEDGIFWMSFEDWQKYFVDLVVCQYKDGFKYSSLKMAPAKGKRTHDFLVKFEVEKPGEYTFGWHMSHRPESPLNRTTTFTVVMFPQAPKMTSKKLLGEDLAHELVGTKQCSSTQREQSFTCERCTKGFYIVHVQLDLGEDGTEVKPGELKHAFTSYGPASLEFTTDVPEFPTMEVWSQQLSQLKEKDLASQQAESKQTAA